jgi:GAF domain-containing protein
MPLQSAGLVLGSLNIYAFESDAFDERAEELGELFAAPAAISVLNAQVLAQARLLVDQLQRALLSRAVIERAMGVLMSRTGCDADEAFEKLRVISQNENRKVGLVAESLLNEAVRRARAAPTIPPFDPDAPDAH